MNKEELIAEAKKHGYEKYEFACNECGYEPKCYYAWDLYNLNTKSGVDCLASK